MQANSVITKCRPFQVKIYSSKLKTDRLQQRRHVTFLIYKQISSNIKKLICLVYFCQG